MASPPPGLISRLARFPRALNGQPGRAQKLIALLQGADLAPAGAEFYNSLEAPALEKYPLLALFQEFLRANGAAATLMSGSGSTTFAVVPGQAAAEALVEKFKAQVWPDELDGGGRPLTRRRKSARNRG